MAYACVSLATLSLSSDSGTVGSTVTGSGKGFSGMMGAVATNVPAQPSPVDIRFGSRSGPVLWTGLPSNTGEINFSFQVPASEPGEAVVFATQYNANGSAVSGTPARASFTVTAPPAAPAAPAAAVVEPAPAVTPAPAAAPAATPAPARVRVAPRATPTAAAPARAVAPAPAPVVAPVAPAPAPVTEVAPAPVVAPVAPPAAEATAAPAPARRSVMVSMASDSDGSPALAIALVGIGLVLALGASAVVLASRRDSKAAAGARRS